MNYLLDDCDLENGYSLTSYDFKEPFFRVDIEDLLIEMQKWKRVGSLPWTNTNVEKHKDIQITGINFT